MVDFKQLKRFSKIDSAKRELIYGVLRDPTRYSEGLMLNRMSFDADSEDYQDVYGEYPSFKVSPIRICPKCHEEYCDETICPNCLVRLKSLDEFNIVHELEINPVFNCKGTSNYTGFDELLTEENYEKIMNFKFGSKDYKKVITSIKSVAYRRLNKAIRENNIDIDLLEIEDIVTLFAKSFVNVEYKSYGYQLDYFEFNRITVDDRQSLSHQITTVLHELSHFLLKEILTHILCKVLDTTKNPFIEAFITFELNNSDLSKLIDEYAAHTVEGRFTIFGYQDYSSFLSIQHNLSDDDVSVAKMIGNSFANTNKDIIEGFIDREFRNEIKNQFKIDNNDAPNYDNLMYESCNALTDEGLCTAIQLLFREAFETADLEILNQYLDGFTQK